MKITNASRMGGAVASAADIEGFPCTLTDNTSVLNINKATSISAGNMYVFVEPAKLQDNTNRDIEPSVAKDDEVLYAVDGEMEIEKDAHGFSEGDVLEIDTTEDAFFKAHSAGTAVAYVAKVLSANKYVAKFDTRPILNA